MTRNKRRSSYFWNGRHWFAKVDWNRWHSFRFHPWPTSHINVDDDSRRPCLRQDNEGWEMFPDWIHRVDSGRPTNVERRNRHWCRGAFKDEQTSSRPIHCEDLERTLAVDAHWLRRWSSYWKRSNDWRMLTECNRCSWHALFRYRWRTKMDHRRERRQVDESNPLPAM